jgi:hypothetical protein
MIPAVFIAVIGEFPSASVPPLKLISCGHNEKFPYFGSMKKSHLNTFRFALLLCLMAGSLISCKKEDEPEPPPPGPVVYTLKYTLPSGAVNLSGAPSAQYSWSSDNRIEYSQWLSGSTTFRIVFATYIDDSTGSGGNDPTDAEQDAMFQVGSYPFGYGTYAATQVLITYNDGVNLYTSDGYQGSSAFNITEVNAASGTTYRKEIKGTFHCTLRSATDTLLLTGGEFTGHFAVPGH